MITVCEPVPVKPANVLRHARSILPFSENSDGKVVFIIGSARSGTTWLAESIVENSAGRYVFEPFSQKATVPLGGPEFDRPYLREYQSYPEIDAFLKKIVEEPFRNRWTDQNNNRFYYRARIIKAVRANMMIGRIARLFPNACIPFVIREPFATVRSQCRLKWPSPLETFLSQTELMVDRPASDHHRLKAASNMFERSVVRWCLENRIALEQVSSVGADNVRVFKYEDLRDDIEKFKDFQQFCGVADYAKCAHGKPSRVSQGKQNFDTRKLDEDFSPNQVVFFKETLQHFGFSEYVDGYAGQG